MGNLEDKTPNYYALGTNLGVTAHFITLQQLPNHIHPQSTTVVDCSTTDYSVDVQVGELDNVNHKCALGLLNKHVITLGSLYSHHQSFSPPLSQSCPNPGSPPWHDGLNSSATITTIPCSAHLRTGKLTNLCALNLCVCAHTKIQCSIASF